MEKVESQEFVTVPGGVMTREAGAVTGEVELWIDPAQADAAKIRYAGAEDEYTVVGSVAGRSLAQLVAALQSDPGVDEDGNPRTTDLTAA